MSKYPTTFILPLTKKPTLLNYKQHAYNVVFISIICSAKKFLYDCKIYQTADAVIKS